MLLEDLPGIIITNDDKVIRTTKIKKYIIKNNIEYKDIKYLDNISNDFKEIERALKALENSYLGLSPIKEKENYNIPTKQYKEVHCFWDTKTKGFYATEYQDLRCWPFATNNFIYVGKMQDNETIEQTFVRLFKQLNQKRDN